MFFGKKEKKCANCNSEVSGKFTFCPHCGETLGDSEKEEKDFGLLGKNDYTPQKVQQPQQNLGITDKIVGSLFNSLMKNLNKQLQNDFQDLEKEFETAEIQTFPNGIKIRIAGQPLRNPAPRKKTTKKNIITQEQIKKMHSLPKTEAKTSVKRIGDKLIYEIAARGVAKPENIFISKLESGYELKAIGDKKVYINNIPINLPLESYSIFKDKILVNFRSVGHGF